MSFIETERLILRTWMPGDDERLLEILSDARIAHYLPMPAKPTIETIRTALERQMEEQDREGFSIWPVVRKEDGRLIGRCGLHRLPEGYVEIAWMFEPAAWGHGYASEAARAAIDYARRALNVRDLYALIDPGNGRSIALANRLGMRFDRVVRAYKRELLRYKA